ncbi:UDP-N-acetylmuramoyl-L-alanyl-D-glutamate--2,6-diaminopimelate ligase [Moheibacter sediminis]|uniref:UDP-N-acetylmuramoyl-L-alanyl-D-glutamate--2,6-diaminopimelate ligase n=1 Tax=Moheibacter sediminis TaxID=1434700 RepID=A0A1W2CT95_9FLAO|nr:UDP-N-acetylmuramoyl-L-alanyl-D-glutamate--2,6-diaminopimelate ligase [Moheibacter sediminis]SMC88441.1 UDP-N-acetylmuramoylalanyl-D-glutamate--2,6-diaminopimelate ligase [Moheibacter sediminis]
MKLKDLLYKVELIEIIGNVDSEILSVEFDSRKIQKGTLFVAQSGTQVDGHDFIQKSIESGAITIVCERKPEEINPNVTYVVVANSSIALGIIASNLYDNPTEKLKLIGITGTNGKTTTSTLTYNLLESLGYATVLISTIRILVHGNEYPSSHTTPNILTLNKIFSEAVQKGCEFAVMEVSSHGIHQNRIAGLHFQIGVFSNITHDHLDYHKTFAEYIKAKKKFFDELPKSALALTNLDDKNGVVMLQNSAAKRYSYALKTDADFKAKILENQFDGMLLLLDGKEFWTPLIGQFNAYNLLAVYSIAILLGIDQEEVLTHLSKLKNVDGRFQTFKSQGGIVAIIDYAHTPDALENVLNTIQNIRTRNEKLITIVGCGGDRDRTKRPEMGKMAARMSELAIFTSDNPRSEDPEEILKEVEAGVEPQFYNRTLKITDRKEAIKTAYKMAEKGDIILIAGKGHETYQEIKGVKHHFDDLETAQELSNQLNK